MSRLRQIVFLAAWLALCWLLMQIVHEAGHVVGAWLTGARVERVVLHPLEISRTDVSRNAHPAIVVWLGPVVGALAPVFAWRIMPRTWRKPRTATAFFAGFCLVANGLYLAGGARQGVGDCGDLVRLGTPIVALEIIGVVAAAAGLVVWHRLGSPRSWLTGQRAASWPATLSCVALLAAIVLAELAWA